MIPYTVPDIERLFAPQAVLARWRQIEIATLRAQQVVGLVPAEWVMAAVGAPAPSVEAWEAATEATKHEVVGFLRAWGVQRIHIGLTSSDLTDTGLMLALRTVNETLASDGRHLARVLAARALDTLEVRRLGRTHGQAAVPDTLGHRLGDLALLAWRNAQRLERVGTAMRVGKIAGPVGGHLTPAVSTRVEHLTLDALGLAPITGSQVIPRDLLADWAATCALAVSGCEAIATEIRLGSHEAVGEIREGFLRGQVGSSAMPGKKNPIMAERITGLSRLARAAVEPIMSGVSQWHDRDLAHSSVERVLVPQLAGITAYALHHTAELVRNLEVYPETMARHLVLNEPGIYQHQAMVQAQLAGQPYDLARQADLVDTAPYEPPTGHLRILLEQIR